MLPSIARYSSSVHKIPMITKTFYDKLNNSMYREDDRVSPG